MIRAFLVLVLSVTVFIILAGYFGFQVQPSQAVGFIADKIQQAVEFVLPFAQKGADAGMQKAKTL